MKTNDISLDDMINSYGDDVKSLYLTAAKILYKYEKAYERKITRTLILDLLATTLSCCVVTVYTRADQSPILLYLLLISFGVAGGVLGGIALRVMNVHYEKEKDELLRELMNDNPVLAVSKNKKILDKALHIDEELLLIFLIVYDIIVIGDMHEESIIYF